MTQAEALDKLIAAVEAGEADFDWGLASSPSRNALQTQWHDAMNAYLGSLDAAKALHDALLPGWRYWISNSFYRDEYGNEFSCKASLVGNRGSVDCFHNTPARAWILAILKAYRANQTQPT